MAAPMSSLAGRWKVISMRAVSLRVGTRTISPHSLPLGMMMRALSSPSISVKNRLISHTEPPTLAVSMRSPIWKGRNSTSMMPAARLLSVPCSASPTAMPSAPSTATKLVVAMPKVVSTATKVKTRTV